MKLIKNLLLINILKLCMAFSFDYDDYSNTLDYSNIDINRFIYETDISDLKVKLKSIDKIFVYDIDLDALDKICQLDLLIERVNENDVIYCRDVRNHRMKRDSQDAESSGDFVGSGDGKDIVAGLTIASVEEEEEFDKKEYAPSADIPLANNDNKEAEIPAISSRFGENIENQTTNEHLKEQDAGTTEVNVSETLAPPTAEPLEPPTTIASEDNETREIEGTDEGKTPQYNDNTNQSTYTSTQSPGSENPNKDANGGVSTTSETLRTGDANPTTAQTISVAIKHNEREAEESIPKEASEDGNIGISRSVIPSKEVPGDVSSVDSKPFEDAPPSNSPSNSRGKVEETNQKLLDSGKENNDNKTGSETKSAETTANAGSISGLNVLIIIVVLVALAGVGAFGYSKYQKRKVHYNVVNAEEEGKEMKEIKRYENVGIRDANEGKPLVDGDVVCVEMENKPHTPSPTPRTFTVTPIPIKKGNSENVENNREGEGGETFENDDNHTENVVNKIP